MTRGIAQSGSAPALGAGGRGFESLCPDQVEWLESHGFKYLSICKFSCLSLMWRSGIIRLFRATVGLKRL